MTAKAPATINIAAQAGPAAVEQNNMRMVQVESRPASLARPTANWWEMLEVVKRKVCPPDTPDDEFKVFCAVAEKRGLDPLIGQIYLVRRYATRKKDVEVPEGSGNWVTKEYKEPVYTIQTGIDGFRAIAHRTGAYAGHSEFKWEMNGNQIVSVEATFWRYVNGQRCDFPAKVWWAEYYPGDAQGQMWRQKPHVMCGKCLEGYGLRQAFPEVLGNIYVDEEMEAAGEVDRRPVSQAPANVQVRQETPQEPPKVVDAVEVKSQPAEPAQPPKTQIDKEAALVDFKSMLEGLNTNVEIETAFKDFTDFWSKQAGGVQVISKAVAMKRRRASELAATK